MLRSIARTILFALVSTTGTLLSQVEARQATPEEAVTAERGPQASPDIEVKNPMLLELKLVRKDGSNIFRNIEIMKGAHVTGYSTTETRKFVCDRARVEQVELIEKKRARRGKPPQFELVVQVASKWFRQDLDVTATLTHPGGEALAKGFWKDLTVGNNVGFYSGFTRRLVIPLKPSIEEYELLVSETRPFPLSIVLEVQDEEGDAGGD